MRNFCCYDCLRTASDSEFHTPGSYGSHPVIKAMQNTDITGCTIVHLLTCLPLGFKKHQLFRTLQFIINRGKYQESLFLQTFRLVIKSQVICFSLELSSQFFTEFKKSYSLLFLHKYFNDRQGVIFSLPSSPGCIFYSHFTTHDLYTLSVLCFFSKGTQPGVYNIPHMEHSKL